MKEQSEYTSEITFSLKTTVEHYIFTLTGGQEIKITFIDGQFDGLKLCTSG